MAPRRIGRPVDEWGGRCGRCGGVCRVINWRIASMLAANARGDMRRLRSAAPKDSERAMMKPLSVPIHGSHFHSRQNSHTRWCCAPALPLA